MAQLLAHGSCPPPASGSVLREGEGAQGCLEIWSNVLQEGFREGQREGAEGQVGPGHRHVPATALGAVTPVEAKPSPCPQKTVRTGAEPPAGRPPLRELGQPMPGALEGRGWPGCSVPGGPGAPGSAEKARLAEASRASRMRGASEGHPAGSSQLFWHQVRCTQESPAS